MSMGCLVRRLLMTWASTVQKCAVLPLSAKAVECWGSGGPTWTVLVERLKKALLDTLGSGSLGTEGIGSPPCQARVDVGN